MRKIRSFASQSPAIIISLIALTFSLGSGAGYAASTVTSHPAKATKITWHHLKLINGWKSAQKEYGENWGYPSYAISNGVVYLSGAISNSAGPNNEAVAVLPRGYRPSTMATFAVAGASVLEGDSDDGSVFVFPDGGITTGLASVDSTAFTSLTGVTFALGS